MYYHTNTNSLQNQNLYLLAVARTASIVSVAIQKIIPALGGSILVHSALADCGGWPGKNYKGQVAGSLAVQLWYLVRSFDPLGSGSAIVNLREAAKTLNLSIYSVRRRLNDGLALGLFRSKRRAGKGKVRIFYTSLAKILLNFQIEDVGACVLGKVIDLDKLKFVATEAEALRLQNRSRWKEDRKRGKKSKLTADPEKLTTSELCNGAILFKRGKLSILKRSSRPYGSSQGRIGWEQSRSISTIQRRLSDEYRAKHGLEPIPKTQLATEPEKLNQFIPGRTIALRRIAPNQKLLEISGFGKIRLCPNVYAFSFSLEAKRSLRGKIKREFQKAEDRILVSNDWKKNPEYLLLKQSLRAAIDKPRLFSEKKRLAGKGGAETLDLLINLKIERVPPA